MHPWHDIKHERRFPEASPAVIEIPRGSKAKYAVDPKTSLLRLDRMLMSAARYRKNARAA